MAGDLRSTYKPTAAIAALFVLVLAAVAGAAYSRHHADRRIGETTAATVWTSCALKRAC